MGLNSGFKGLIYKEWDEGMDWIDPVQDMDKWQAIVNAVMNRHVPHNITK